MWNLKGQYESISIACIRIHRQKVNFKYKYIEHNTRINDANDFIKLIVESLHHLNQSEIIKHLSIRKYWRAIGMQHQSNHYKIESVTINSDSSVNCCIAIHTFRFQICIQMGAHFSFHENDCDCFGRKVQNESARQFLYSFLSQKHFFNYVASVSFPSLKLKFERKMFLSWVRVKLAGATFDFHIVVQF